MLERLQKIIETKHMHVLFVIIVFTLVFSMFLPSIEFRTNIEEFYPENDAVRADEKIEERFGKDPFLQYVYVGAKGSDPKSPDGTVLSLEALQEEYQISLEVRKLPGVVGTISVAEYLHTFLSLNDIPSFLDTNWSRLKEALFNLDSDSSQEQFYFLEYMLIHKALDLNPIFEGKAPLADATLIIVQIDASLSNNDRKELANEIRETVHEMSLEYVKTEQTGADLMAYQVDEVSNQTNMYMGAGIIILITVILYLSFRRMSYVILPLLTLLLATIWTLGTMVILGLEFTALDVAVLPLLIGLGIDDAVHVSRRYQEELRKNKKNHLDLKPKLAMAVTMKSIGTAIFLTSLTTIIAFLSNGVSGVKPVKEFGFVCAIGIIYAFLLTVTFYVGMRYWLDKRGGQKIELDIRDEAPKMDILLARTALTIDSHPRAVIAFVIVITVLSIFGATQVRTEFSVKEFLPEDLPSMKTGNDIEKDFHGGSYTTAYVLYEGKGIDTVEAIDVMANTYENIKDDKHLVNISVFISSGSKTLSKPAFQITTPLTILGRAFEKNESLAERYNFVKIENKDELRDTWLPNQATNEDIQALYDHLYDNHTETDPLSGDTYAELIREVLHRDDNGEYSAFLIKLFVRAKDSEASRIVYDEIKDDVIPLPGTKYYITGTVILLIQTVDSIQDSQIQSTTIAILLAAIILCFIYKDVELGLISVLPVALNVTWILGTMAFITYLHDTVWSGFPSMSLNVLTVTVTSLSIGLGIDYSIHVVQRFRENLFEEHESIQDAIRSTLQHTGSALFISAATTVTGFGVLIFAPMPLTQMFGIITAASIVFSLLSTTIFLPILLVAWAKYHKRFQIKDKDGQIPRKDLKLVTRDPLLKKKTDSEPDPAKSNIQTDTVSMMGSIKDPMTHPVAVPAPVSATGPTTVPETVDVSALEEKIGVKTDVE